jgi:hypothetical protein
MKSFVRPEKETRVAHEFGLADLGSEKAFAAVESLPMIAVGTPREVEAVFAVIDEVGEEIGFCAGGRRQEEEEDK